MARTLLLVLATALLVVEADAAVDPAAHCSGLKLKAAVRKSSAKLKCHANAALRGVPVDAACLTKAETKFNAAWQRIEGAGGCRTLDDAHETEIQVDAFVSFLAVKLAPCGTVDGVCGGSCPFGLQCFQIGVGCYGESEPCRCHDSTTTCPTTSTTSTTLP